MAEYGALGLIVVGGLLQLLAVVWILRGVLKARRSVAAYRTRPQTIHLESARLELAFGRTTVTGGAPPTLEQRVEYLERKVMNLEDGTDARISDLDRELRAEISNSGRTVRENVLVNELRPLADLVVNLADEGVWAAACLMVGLVLATGGSAWSVFV